jgi:hypothetical protein
VTPFDGTTSRQRAAAGSHPFGHSTTYSPQVSASPLHAVHDAGAAGAGEVARAPLVPAAHAAGLRARLEAAAREQGDRRDQEDPHPDSLSC